MNDRGWIPRCGLVYGDESAMTEPIQQVTGTQPSRLPSRSASARWLAFVIALMLTGAMDTGQRRFVLGALRDPRGSIRALRGG